MTQGEIEKLGQKTSKIFSELEIRIMSDIVRRIKINGFSTASADWQITRLQQLGKSEKDIRKWIQEALEASDEEIEQIFSDEVYKQYMGFERGYKAFGKEQIPFENNIPLQHLINATKEQISLEFNNMANSMGFAIRDSTGNITYTPLLDFYRSTLDNAVIDIQSGAFSYQNVLERTVRKMTASGVRWIDYDSGWHNRVDVAARRAVLTGFRQVQGRINEQVAAELDTDYYEVSYHVGARPTHQPWQGRVWNYKELESVCGLGSVTGLHGANCYHDYTCFIPGVSVRTYTDKQLEKMIAEENVPREYNGKQYTTYEALQQQRKMETNMRRTRQEIKLLQDGASDETAITLKRAKYYGQMQTYEAFSRKIGLPLQKKRIYQDGLKGTFSDKRAYDKIQSKRTASKAGGKAAIRNTNTKVSYNPKKTYQIKLEMCSDKVNEGLSEAIKDVAIKGSKNGSEHMYLVDLLSGELSYYETNGLPNEVGYDFWKFISENKDKKFAFVHNHNTDSSFSETDMRTLLTTDQIPLMIAARNDGVIYVAERAEKILKSGWFDNLYKEDITALNQQVKDGIITVAERAQRREMIIVDNLLRDYTKGGKLIEYDG